MGSGQPARGRSARSRRRNRAEVCGAHAEARPLLGPDGSCPGGDRRRSRAEPDRYTDEVGAADLAAEGAARRRDADTERYLAARASDRAHDAGVAALSFRRRRFPAAGPSRRADTVRVEAGASCAKSGSDPRRQLRSACLQDRPAGFGVAGNCAARRLKKDCAAGDRAADRNRAACDGAAASNSAADRNRAACDGAAASNSAASNSATGDSDAGCCRIDQDRTAGGDARPGRSEKDRPAASFDHRRGSFGRRASGRRSAAGAGRTGSSRSASAWEHRGACMGT